MKKLSFLLLVLGLNSLVVLDASAATTILPLPTDATAIAGWGGTATFWQNVTPHNTPVPGVSTEGNFALSSNGSVGNGRPGAINRTMPVSVTLSAADYTGEVPETFTLQLASFYGPQAITFTIGDTVYNLAQATQQTVSNFHTTGFNDARYTDTGYTGTAPPTLRSYTWNLEDLGFTGSDFSDFSLTLDMPAYMYIYDVQLAVTSAAAIPEPTITGLMCMGMIAMTLRRRRQSSK